MALQILVEKVSVADAGSQFGGKLLYVTANLKLWAEGDNPEVDDPLFDKNFTADYRSIEGLTVAQQVQRTEDILKADMQYAIDTYKYEMALYNHALLDASITDLNDDLVG